MNYHLQIADWLETEAEEIGVGQYSQLGDARASLTFASEAIRNARVHHCGGLLITQSPKYGCNCLGCGVYVTNQEYEGSPYFT